MQCSYLEINISHSYTVVFIQSFCVHSIPLPTNSSNSTTSIHVHDEQKPIFVLTICVKLSKGVHSDC